MALCFERERGLSSQPWQDALVCRRSATLFDFSFMFSARISGPDAAFAIERYLGRPVSDMALNTIRYGVHSDARGMVISDLTVWRVSADTFDLMSGARSDISFFEGLTSNRLRVEETSDQSRVYAIQGPQCLSLLDRSQVPADVEALNYFQFTDTKMFGVPVRCGRLGYTGERGFELIVAQQFAEELWRSLRERMPSATFATAWPSRGELAVTSACFSPLANATLGLGFALTTDLSDGVELADPLGDFQSVRITSRPYYDPLKLKVRGGWDSLLQPDS
ncbi:MAG: hypothetical protein EBZ14_08530 [Gammaproteobacteria bacterium]|nr:hypothetical protein [Gammaproteobacteria bacterium]